MPETRIVVMKGPFRTLNSRETAINAAVSNRRSKASEDVEGTEPILERSGAASTSQSLRKPTRKPVIQTRRGTGSTPSSAVCLEAQEFIHSVACSTPDDNNHEDDDDDLHT